VSVHTEQIGEERVAAFHLRELTGESDVHDIVDAEPATA